MAYKYDVFLSYTTKYPHGEWVIDEFFPFFKSFLEDSIGIKNIDIFIDKAEIKSGNAWEKKITEALIHSRIMVSVLSPSYFNSDWCKKEFAFMDYRQRKSGYLSQDNPNGLIVPLKIRDGEHFPDYLKTIQIANFNNYLRVGEGFRKTPLYVEFQGKLQDWVEDVKHAYNLAPEWNEDWKHPDWINKAWEDLDKLKGSPTKNHPVL